MEGGDIPSSIHIGRLRTVISAYLHLGVTTQEINVTSSRVQIVENQNNETKRKENGQCKLLTPLTYRFENETTLTKFHKTRFWGGLALLGAKIQLQKHFPISQYNILTNSSTLYCCFIQKNSHNNSLAGTIIILSVLTLKTIMILWFNMHYQVLPHVIKLSMIRCHCSNFCHRTLGGP